MTQEDAMTKFYQEREAELRKRGYTDEEIERQLDAMVNMANMVMIAVW
jgi:Pyruvate/2-oxoacid:ferredoxin oxidoreductase gamma subunit